MSTVPRTEAPILQENQSRVEHNDSRPALLYLFNEVSKLAAPIPNSLPDTKPSLKKPDASDDQKSKKEKQEPTTCISAEAPLVNEHLFQSAHSSHRHDLSCMKPYNHMENVMEEGHSSDALTLPHSERNSPWKALSLINLHCERLLNEEDVEMPSFSLGLSSSRGDHSNGTFTTAAAGLKEGGLISAQAHKLERRHRANEENEAAADNSTSPRLDLLTATAPERRRERNDEKDQPCTNKCRPKTQRKQPHPSRSADIQDPGFQGVAFRIEAELDDNREQCRLLITSKYSNELCKTGRKLKLRTRTSQRLAKTSSSDEENDQMAHKGKICASCCTRKTPMWRDAEDGTPLCNACGIRYKKYRVRCVKCWLIPRKEGNSSLLCMRCGNCVKLTSSAHGWSQTD
uniref:Zinc finger GATA like protein 1 n=1 Tax=Cyprinodon variegatus TaxID=28743 RepID=A0A3Q2DS59_CYPVA